jgi:hypothetical protein
MNDAISTSLLYKIAGKWDRSMSDFLKKILPAEQPIG